MKHQFPVLIATKELLAAAEIMRATPEAPFCAFFDYEISTEAARDIAATKIREDIKAVQDGTHPMFSKTYLKDKLEDIKLECRELEINMVGRPLPDILIELNHKRNRIKDKERARAQKEDK